MGLRRFKVAHMISIYVELLFRHFSGFANVCLRYSAFGRVNGNPTVLCFRSSVNFCTINHSPIFVLLQRLLLSARNSIPSDDSVHVTNGI